MPFSVSPVATWKAVKACWVGRSGGWKRVIGRWIGVGGAWKLYFSAGTVELVPVTVRGVANDPDTPIARIDFNRNGSSLGSFTDTTILATADTGNWYDPTDTTVGDGFEIKASVVGGVATVAGSALGSWLALSSARGWEIDGTALRNAAVSISLQIDIRPVGGSAPIATALVSLSVVTWGVAYPIGVTGRNGGVDIGPRSRFEPV
jgi:hypothetical protein